MIGSRFTTLSAGIAVLVLLFAAGPAHAAVAVNMSGGSSFSRGILGQTPMAGYSANINDQTLALSQNASVRGVAGGLDADTYNWENLVDDYDSEYVVPPLTTLGFLQQARDQNAQVVLTANVRGIGDNGGVMGGFQYTDTSVGTLATLAANWVRYTNYIVQNYRQGDTITVPGDAAILTAMGGSWPAGKLLSSGELPTSKVTYWEIGNEPGDNYGVYYPLSPADYLSRYKSISSAMVAQDPTIKVGPCGLNPTELSTVLGDSSARVDFVSYHPYGTVGAISQTSASQVQTDLRGVKQAQIDAKQAIVTALQSSGRPTNTPLIASEWNPSGGGQPAGQPFANSMAQALGIAETAFSFAELGVSKGMYWNYPSATDPLGSSPNTGLPAYQTFVALRDHMGDTLVSSWYGTGVSSTHTSSSSVRLYVTKDSLTGEVDLWGLNFANARGRGGEPTVTVDLGDLGFTTTTGTLMTLGADPGYAQQLLNPTGSASQTYIDWHSTLLTGLDTSNLTLTLGHAEITLLVS